MIPCMVGKLAPSSIHSTRGLVKYVFRRGYFRAQTGTTFFHPRPPQSLNDSEEIVVYRKVRRRDDSMSVIVEVIFVFRFSYAGVALGCYFGCNFVRLDF